MVNNPEFPLPKKAKRGDEVYASQKCSSGQICATIETGFCQHFHNPIQVYTDLRSLCKKATNQSILTWKNINLQPIGVNPHYLAI
jgi:hypothetical protein